MLDFFVRGRRLASSILSLSLIAGAGTALLLSGCQNNAPGNESQFVIHSSTSNREIMKRFYNNLATAKQVDVCIGFVGFEKGSEKVQTHVDVALRSLKRWFNALRSLESWKGKSVPELSHRVQYEACRYEHLVDGDRFGITFFATQRHFTSQICGSLSPVTMDSTGAVIGQIPQSLLTSICKQNQGASLGYNGQGAIYISPLANAQSEEHIMHELGHVMGLGDTYPIAGSAPSLMNLKSGVEPSPDDLAGIEQILAYIEGREIGCPAGPVKRLSSSDGTERLYCAIKEDWSQTRLDHLKLEEATRKQSSPTDQIQSTFRQQVLLTFSRDSFFKASPDRQAADMGEDEICGVREGQRFIVTLDASKDKSGHSFYQFDSPIEGCPDSVSRQGYFFTSHATLKNYRTK